MGVETMKLRAWAGVGVALMWLCLGGGGVAFAQSNIPPGSIPLDSDSGDLGALVVRIDHLEAELRRATGQIEELQNQNQRLEEQFKRFREDVEYRLGGAKPPGGPAAGPAATAMSDPAPTAKSRKNDAFDPGLDPNAPGKPKAMGTALPSTPLGAPLDIERPNGLSAAPKPADPPPVVINSGLGFTDGPREQFNTAVEAYKAGQYADAEAQLKAFLAANPTHRLAADATFFLGETYLQRSRPREAAEQYLKLSTDYGRSVRAPDGMMRLGQSLAMLGNAEQACATFAEVGKRYPAASSQVRKTVEREMQKDHC
jgi:tol-pal system protein YbgF